MHLHWESDVRSIAENIKIAITLHDHYDLLHDDWKLYVPWTLYKASNLLWKNCTSSTELLFEAGIFLIILVWAIIWSSVLIDNKNTNVNKFCRLRHKKIYNSKYHNNLTQRFWNTAIPRLNSTCITMREIERFFFY